MRRSCALAFALALTVASPATRVSAPDAKFTAEVLPAGTKLVVGSATTRNLIVVKPGKAETVSNGTETVTTNFTATVVQSERSIDRLRIDFGSCPFTSGARAKNPSREQAIAHKAFEMFRKDGKNVFTGANGAELSDADRLAVQPHFLPLIFELPLAHLLAGKTLKKGAQLELPVEAANSLLASYRAVLPGGKATLTFVEEKVADAQECAVFTLAATLPLLDDAQAGARFVVDVTGELTVTKRQCLVLYATCEGSCAFAVKNGALAKETWTYYVKFG
jgi:hypothetical protein